MNAGMKMIKYLMFAFNFIFVIFGFALIGLGAYVEIKYRDVAVLTTNAIASGPLLMVAVGVFMLLLAFFGCCGAYKESYCMITCFAVFMSFIFILELAGTLTAYILKAKVETWMNNSFNQSVTDYTRSDGDNKLDIVQQNFKCCGGKSPADYQFNEKFENDSQEIIKKLNLTGTRDISVPDSCCEDDSVAHCGLMNSTKIFEEGCSNKIVVGFNEQILVIGGVGLAVVFIQLTGIGFSCLLMRSIKTNYEVV